MTDAAATGGDPVRAAEIVAALSLATDLALGMELEHGLRAALAGVRLAQRLEVDAGTAAQVYFVCLLFYVGCTADADEASRLFATDSSLLRHVTPVMFGSRREIARGVVRATAPPGGAWPRQALGVARRVPRVARMHRRHQRATCEVAQRLTARLGLPADVHSSFAALFERWDGGGPDGIRGDAIPLAVRIAHVARDAVFQTDLHGIDGAVEVLRDRAGGAFDPSLVALVAGDPRAMLALHDAASAWEEVLELEPEPHVTLSADGVDRALGAVGDFADLSSPFLVGHSAGVAALAAAAAQQCHLPPDHVSAARRAGLAHDLGRVSVPVRVWNAPGPLGPAAWDQVRLHPYWSERILGRAPCLAPYAALAGLHHERLDASGYYRGAGPAELPIVARLLAAADAYHAMTEPRPHRPPLTGDHLAATIAGEAGAGRLDADAIAAVLEAAGRPAPRLERPNGLTGREVEVIGLVARGLQTKQIAHLLGISPKTADSHIQHAYAKIGVSTRAAATVFAMEHGMAASGKLPMVGARRRP
jgi:HD-GYP domain-containing protein (c-di-GMP phosphodiesterase class II)